MNAPVLYDVNDVPANGQGIIVLDGEQFLFKDGKILDPLTNLWIKSSAWRYFKKPMTMAVEEPETFETTQRGREKAKKEFEEKAFDENKVKNYEEIEYDYSKYFVFGILILIIFWIAK